MKCEHGKERTRCKSCADLGTGGGSFCEHGRMRTGCPICSPENSYAACAAKAKKRNLSFSLSLTEFQKLTQAECILCGQQPCLGVDRKDSRLGYISNGSIQNCQPCCWTCNQLKRNIRNGNVENQQALLAHILKIAAHQEKLRKQKLVPPQIAA